MKAWELPRQGGKCAGTGALGIPFQQALALEAAADAPGRYLLEAALEINAPDTTVSRLHHGYFLTLEVPAR